MPDTIATPPIRRQSIATRAAISPDAVPPDARELDEELNGALLWVTCS